MRIALGIVAGIVVAFGCVFVIEAIGHTVYPPPPGINLEDPASIERLMAVTPAAALVFVVVAWFAGALAGAATANFIGQTRLAGLLVAALVILAAVGTMVVIPHPAWMWAAGILLPILAALIAARFVHRAPVS